MSDKPKFVALLIPGVDSASSGDGTPTFDSELVTFDSDLFTMDNE